MLALDSWRWMPVRQACRLVGRQDVDAMEGTRLRARTQFGRRLILPNAIDAYELIPPEVEDEDYEKPEPVFIKPICSRKLILKLIRFRGYSQTFFCVYGRLPDLLNFLKI
jgi:hypothetical protein